MKMIFNTHGGNHVAHTYDLVRSLFDVLRDVHTKKIKVIASQSDQIRDTQDNKSEGELKLIKNVEIVADVFRKAAEKVAKMGEREWKEVIEQ